jgi:hypothetical protein
MMKTPGTTAIFIYNLTEIGNIRINLSFSTLGFACVFDEGSLDIIFLVFYITWRRETEK